MDILRDPALQGPDKEAARKQKVRKLIAAGFNYTEMAARSLGSHWDKLTRKQRQGFVDLFGDLFEISYSQMVLESLPDRQTNPSKRIPSHSVRQQEKPRGPSDRLISRSSGGAAHRRSLPPGTSQGPLEEDRAGAG